MQMTDLIYLGNYMAVI